MNRICMCDEEATCDIPHPAVMTRMKERIDDDWMFGSRICKLNPPTIVLLLIAISIAIIELHDEGSRVPWRVQQVESFDLSSMK